MLNTNEDTGQDLEQLLIERALRREQVPEINTQNPVRGPWVFVSTGELCSDDSNTCYNHDREIQRIRMHLRAKQIQRGMIPNATLDDAQAAWVKQQKEEEPIAITPLFIGLCVGAMLFLIPIVLEILS
jgi:hypothetical protein